MGKTPSNPQRGWFRVEVIDSGIGIASDVLPRIFDPFEQGDRAGSGGLGLGLTISKAIVELHEGRIFASSAGANRGTTFVIEIPNVVPSSAGCNSVGRISTGCAKAATLLMRVPHNDKPNRLRKNSFVT